MKLETIWNTPTRVFHWSLVIAVFVSGYTGLNGGFVEMDYHLLSGYLVLSLIIFRISWGLFSRGNARFSDFVVGPRRILYYIQAASAETSQGHSPLGALSILSMLAILLIQTSTGLFSNDDILVEGPLKHLVSDKLSRQLTSIHHLTAWLVAALAGLHIGAILFQELIKKNRIVKAMFNGKKYLNSTQHIDNSNQLPLALLLATISISAVYLLVNYL